MDQKGVNPLIATILLLLVVMAIGGIIWQFLYANVEQQEAAATEAGARFAECGKASFKADLLDVAPTYYDDMNVVRIVLLNNGRRDLNEFRVTAFCSDGSSDQNMHSDVDLEEGGSAVVWATAEQNCGKPERVDIEATECAGVKTTVNYQEIATG